MSEQEMTERYLYEVTKRVPQDSKDDIRMELKALIEDMCAEEQISVEEALRKLGAPEELAKRYQGNGGYVIGPDYYDNYIWVIKIALAGIGISAAVSAIMNGILHADSIVPFFTLFFQELISTAVNGFCSVIGIITIIFAVLEHQNIKLELKPEKEWSVKELTKNTAFARQWSPSLLPPVPDKRIVISRSDSVVSLIMISLFSALLFFAPQLFGAFRYENGKIIHIACIFNLDQWQLLLPVLLLWLFIGFVDEIIRLVAGHYCKLVMYSSIICSILEIVISAVLLKVLSLWNPDFADQLKTAAGISQYSKGDLLYYWESGMLSNILLILIVIVSLAEMGTAIYKTLKYAQPEKN